MRCKLWRSPTFATRAVPCVLSRLIRHLPRTYTTYLCGGPWT